MSKLLWLLIIISSFFIGCTKTTVNTKKEDCPPQPKPEIVVVDSSILKYACVISLSELKAKVSDKDIRTFFSWYDNLPKKILKGIDNHTFTMEINSFILEKNLTDDDIDLHIQYLNELEKFIHMIIGNINRFPIAKMSFAIFPNETSDTSYIKISLNKMVF